MLTLSILAAWSVRCVDGHTQVPTVTVAFSNKLGAHLEDTIVWSSGRILGTLKGPYQVRQWVPTWHALMLVDGPRLVSWKIGSKEPKIVTDLSSAIPGLSSEPDYAFASVSPNGKKIAVQSDDLLYIVKLGVKGGVTLVRRVSLRQGAGHLHLPDVFGLAWSPDGSTVAVGIVPRAWPDASDGSGPTLCAVVPEHRSPRIVGTGAPIAWLDLNHVLCAEVGPGLDVRAVSLPILGGGKKVSKLWGTEIGWSGTAVLVGHPGKINVVSRNLRLAGSSLRVGAYKDSRWTLPPPSLVGIPNEERPLAAHS